MLRANQKKIALVLSVAFIGFLIWSSVQFQQLFTSIIPYFENLAHKNTLLSVTVFIALGIFSTMVSSFSSVPLVPIAVIVWGIVPTAVYLFVGWMIGDVLSYFIGYWAGNSLFRRFISFEKIEYYRRKFPPNAELKLVFFFIMSMPAEIPNYTLGTLRYNFLRYFLIVALGESIFAYFTAYAGQALIEKNFVLFIGTVAFLLFFFSYSLYLFKKYLRTKSSSDVSSPRQKK